MVLDGGMDANLKSLQKHLFYRGSMVYYRDMKTGAVFQYKETWKPYLYWMRVPRREFREYVKTHNAAKAKGKVAFSEFMSELFKTVGIGEYFET